MVRSPDGDPDFFDIVARVLQRETLTDTDFTDDFGLLANTRQSWIPTSLEQAVGWIGLYMIANKTEPMYFKQKGAFLL